MKKGRPSRDGLQGVRTVHTPFHRGSGSGGRHAAPGQEDGDAALCLARPAATVLGEKMLVPSLDPSDSYLVEDHVPAGRRLQRAWVDGLAIGSCHIPPRGLLPARWWIDPGYRHHRRLGRRRLASRTEPARSHSAPSNASTPRASDDAIIRTA
jgi:hypothetical protein